MHSLTAKQVLKGFPEFLIQKYPWYHEDNIKHVQKVWGSNIKRLCISNIDDLVSSRYKYLFLVGKMLIEEIKNREQSKPDNRRNDLTLGRVVKEGEKYYIEINKVVDKIELVLNDDYPKKQYKTETEYGLKPVYVYYIEDVSE